MCTIDHLVRFPFVRFLLILLVSTLSYDVWAQENAVEAKDSLKVVKTESISLTSISSEAERTSLDLKKKKTIMLNYESARKIRKDAIEFQMRYNELQGRSDSAHLAMGTQNGLRDLRLKWMRLEEQLDGWQDDLGKQTVELEDALTELNDLKERWSLTNDQAIMDSVPAVILQRIEEELTEVEAVRAAMRDTLSTYVVGMDKIVQSLLNIREHIEHIRIEEDRAWSGIFSKDNLAIWEKGVADRRARKVVADQLGISYNEVLDESKRFISERSEQVWKQMVILLSLLVLTIYLFTRTRKLPDEVKEELGAAYQLIRRPFSSAFLLALLAFPILYKNPPVLIEEVFIFILMLPLISLIPVLIDKRLKLPFFILVFIFIIDQFQILNAKELMSQRALLFAENLIGLGSLLWFFRSGSPLKEVKFSKLGRTALNLVPVLIVILAISLLANVSGRVALSRIILLAITQSAMAGVIIFAGLQIIKGILIFLLKYTPVKDLNISLKYSDRIQRISIRTLRTFAIFWWMTIFLDQFSIWEPLKNMVIEFTTNEWSYGTTSVSIWNILQFFIVLFFSLTIANLLRVLLEEEILVRFRLGKGMPMSIAFVVKYTIVVSGFFLAVGAAGIDLDKFAFVFGALGVGIGFGLQSLVANFISGIILVFERPIHVNDVVELSQGGLQGTVTQIGVRASKVRTWDGAEVIVPNGDLITKQVTNWTLSDEQRRREVKISTALNADPDQVLDIMRKVASLHPDVISEPEPAAYFLGYTDNTLDFRLLFWVTKNLLRSNSDVALGVYHELKEAGIEVPVQRRVVQLKGKVDDPPPPLQSSPPEVSE